MSKKKNIVFFSWMTALLFFPIDRPAFSQEYSDVITGEYLRTQFAFQKGEKLKYSQCERKSYSTCTYIWGIESKKDASRAKHGLAPQGDRLTVIYVPSSGMKAFQKATLTYSDAKEISDMGVKSVWSSRRKQLSTITDKNLIIHINLDGVAKVVDAEETAISIARHITEKI